MFLCFEQSGDGRSCHVAEDIKMRFTEHEAETIHGHRKISIGGSESELMNDMTMSRTTFKMPYWRLDQMNHTTTLRC